MLKTNQTSGFDALRVPDRLCALLAKHGITVPTPIQAKAIPAGLAGSDLIGIAQTGTGKTLAFGLPISANLKDGGIGLVLAPTRELAQQIAETFYKLNSKCVLIVGGASMGAQIGLLKLRHDVIVATPGRLIDHMERGTVDLSRVRIAVLDEADRMLDMGFAPSIRRIMESVPLERQTLLFSATMPEEIEELAASYLHNPVRIEVESSGSTPDLIDQQLIVVPFEEKAPALSSVLDEHRGPVLVFTRTKHGARKAAKAIRGMGHSAVEIHSDRTLAQRRAAMAGFKDGEYRVLVATDIASRGIDVKGIELVVNYDLPDQAEDYIHRIGRTGRAGSTGRAITIALPQQRRQLREIQQLIGMEIPLRGALPAKEEPAREPSHRMRPDEVKPSDGPKDRSDGPRRARNADRPRVARRKTAGEQRSNETVPKRESKPGQAPKAKSDRPAASSAPKGSRSNKNAPDRFTPKRFKVKARQKRRSSR